MIEKTILSGMVFSETYTRKVLPFLKAEYFDQYEYKLIFETISDYIVKYNTLPNKDVLALNISQIETMSETQFKTVSLIVNDLSFESDTSIEWLTDSTEKFCQDKALYNAIRSSILILDGKDKNLDKGSIPDLLSTALSVTFDTNVGHDFIEDAESRYDFYNQTEERIPFDLDYLNRITKGGLPRKTLNVVLANTGVGKTLFMTHMAAANLSMGKNVLYITMEMAEERIAERIDANLLDIKLDDLSVIAKEKYLSKMNRLKERTTGKLIIKEYPTGTASSNHFRHLLQELKMKKKFIPDIIYIDYLNICASSRLKVAASLNSYLYIKSIAEELRGLAVEFKLPIVSATQSNRDGATNSDPDLTNTSESYGLPFTVDFMIVLVSSEELESMGQLMVKQLKNRYSSLETHKRFVIGIDRSKMKLYDAESSAQTNIMKSTTQAKQDTSPETILKQLSKKKPKFEGMT